MMMKVQINGESKEFEGDLTLSQLLKKLGLSGSGVALEHNRHVVHRDVWKTTVLRENDKIEIVRAIGGGC